MYRSIAVVPMLAAVAWIAPPAGSVAPTAAPPACCVAGAEAPSPLAPIARLAGTWVKADATGAATDEVVSIIRPTAGGTAFLETLFPGSDMEMISMYFAEQGRLKMTHYCLMGNQPTYEATVSDDGTELVFHCRGGGNLADHEVAHMHEGHLRIVDADHIESRWTALAAGEVIEEVPFQLVRRRAP